MRKFAVRLKGPYAQGWAAADHKELIASIEIEQKTCCTTTPWSTYFFFFFPLFFARGLSCCVGTGFNRRYRGMWAEFYDSLFNLTRAFFQLFITVRS